MKRVFATNGKGERMGDLIDRQAAIDAFEPDHPVDWYTTMIVDVLEGLPSAQSETHEERTKTHACDLISRQDSVKKMYDLCEDIDSESLHIDVIVDALENLPSAEPRKKGKWILVTDNRGQHFECDKCGEWRYHQGQNFCSHCGADMREGEEE